VTRSDDVRRGSWACSAHSASAIQVERRAREALATRTLHRWASLMITPGAGRAQRSTSLRIAELSASCESGRSSSATHLHDPPDPAGAGVLPHRTGSSGGTRPCATRSDVVFTPTRARAGARRCSDHLARVACCGTATGDRTCPTRTASRPDRRHGRTRYASPASAPPRAVQTAVERDQSPLTRGRATHVPPPYIAQRPVRGCRTGRHRRAAPLRPLARPSLCSVVGSTCDRPCARLLDRSSGGGLLTAILRAACAGRYFSRADPVIGSSPSRPVVGVFARLSCSWISY
jgi:hypothetical protein